MKTPPATLNRSLLAVSVFLALAAVTAFAATQGAGQKAKTAAAPKSEPIEVPRSEFAIPSQASEGRDPFYPLSRRMMVQTAPPKTGETPKPAVISLSLKGISRNATGRFALINDKTFAEDEERDVTVGSAKVRVHCIEIRDDSVLIDANGGRQELRMKPGL